MGEQSASVLSDIVSTYPDNAEVQVDPELLEIIARTETLLGAVLDTSQATVFLLQEWL